MFTPADRQEASCCLDNDRPKLRAIFHCALGSAVNFNINGHGSGRGNDFTRGNDHGQGKCRAAAASALASSSVNAIPSVYAAAWAGAKGLLGAGLISSD